MAHQTMQYVNTMGRLPPPSPSQDSYGEATSSSWPRTSHHSSNSEAEEDSVAIVDENVPHLGWISIQPYNINDICAQGLILNVQVAQTLVAAAVVGVPLLLPRKCFSYDESAVHW
eukprot:Gregarina_sp_Poly_1__11316@NODE_947_length_5591_cov_64_240043_g671_i0_p8_GENE_NODE_947_length_5591_cov_64_240043_g671_i0NODE_947_length_5591_cov_64_240043_g671_i0_p8_ORF_typecomplete_len115_score18_18_NODE_947_length_5591_cov_64_240043_g671_i044394783